MKATFQEVTTSSPEETLAFGQRLAAEVEAPALILLYGGLGAGKTVLVKGIVSGLGVASEEEVTSPSFVFIHTYKNHRRVYHVDLYRVDQPAELETLGLDDVLAERAVVLVEWAERLRLPVLRPALRIYLRPVGDEQRYIRVERE